MRATSKVLGFPGSNSSKKSYTDEPRIFTNYVRLLSTGTPPDPLRYEELREALRSALRNELNKRGLWDAPPSYLGIYGWTTWEPNAGSSKENALEELVAECYAFIFVNRLRSIQAHLNIKPNIDGLVYLNIRHFLHERQRVYDPLGAQVFEVVQSAVRLAVEEGEIRVLKGDERVRNDTVLGFQSGTVSSGWGKANLPQVVSRWNDELLPDLVILRGRRQEEVTKRLRNQLPDLLQHGIEVFRFKDLLDTFKADVRARWAAILDRTQGEYVEIGEEDKPKKLLRYVEPDLKVEENQAYFKLTSCVDASIKRLEVDAKTQAYLTTLWEFLKIRTAESIDPQRASRLGPGLGAELSDGDEVLSHRQLAEQLHIPRERLPALYRTLGDLLESCRSSLGRYHGALSVLAANSRKVPVSKE